jgi:RecB family exonuclease
MVGILLFEIDDITQTSNKLVNDRRIAEIWPSRAALDQELSRRAKEQGAGQGGLLLCPPFYTFDTLLPQILAQVPLPPGIRPLKPLAGPILVHSLLRQKDQHAFAGMAAGRRLPEGLWRLLVEVKAAGLDSAGIAALGNGENARLSSLAGLLAEYEDSLKEKGLADQTDQLSALEAMLLGGERPVMLQAWDKLICRGVLWLRTLDIRLIRALARVMETRVEFAMWPGMSGQPALQRLMENTAKALEAKPHPEMLSLVWQELRAGTGPLNDLITAYLDPSHPYEGQGEENIEIVMAAGRYGLAESLVNRARELIQGGVPPQEVALVFPDLSVYGPMVADVARRLRLPLNMSNGLLLGKTPLGQTLLRLLELPLLDYERENLADVLASPYLREPLERLCLEPGEKLPQDAGWLLKRAGYIDSKDWDGVQWLERAAAREESKEGGKSRLVGHYRILSRLLNKLKAILAIFSQQCNIIDYCEEIIGLVNDLDPAIAAPGDVAGMEGVCLATEAVQVRDLASKTRFLGTVQDILAAAAQADAREKLTPGRLLAILREALNQVKLPQGHGAAEGVTVHRLADTLGLKARAVLVGGLNQGEFPQRPQGLNLLSSHYRLILGKAAKRPVWRTDDEEYQGQVLGLAWLLANCSQKAVIGAAGADVSGRKQAPAIVMEDLARLLGQELQSVNGGILGEIPPLTLVREPAALAMRLAADVLRHHPNDTSLAQACLWHLNQIPQHRQKWRGVALRAKEMQNRLRLNTVPAEQRAHMADEFNGIFKTPQALAQVKNILGDKRFREISPSYLEMYAQCPMAWFVKYLLGIKIVSEPGWTLEARSEGEWVHRILALFFDPAEFDTALDSAALDERLSRCMKQAKDELASELPALPVIWEARQDALRTALRQVITREIAEMADARPIAIEQEIAIEGKGLEIPVDDGPPLIIKGRLDRMDEGAKGLVVSDYKHTSDDAAIKDPANQELAGVSQFQLPVYLAFARQARGREGITLSGRIVPTLLPGAKTRKMDFAYDDEFLTTDAKVRDRIARDGKINLYNAIAKIWLSLASGGFAALPSDKACQYCDINQACYAQSTNAAADLTASG